MKEPLNIGVLSEEEKKIAEDLLKYYKYVRICKWCHVLFGDDNELTSYHCPNCIKKLRDKNDQQRRRKSTRGWRTT